MIVLDASVVVELLTNRALADTIRLAIAESDEALIAPYLLDIEVMNAVRGLAAARLIGQDAAQEIVANLTDLPVDRLEHIPFLHRIWELRHNLTAYDATYIAIAEATDSTLFTMDGKLARGHRASVRVFSSSDAT